MTVSSDAKSLDSNLTDAILRYSIFTSVCCITLFNRLKLSIDAFCSCKFKLKTTEPAPKK